MIFDITYDIPTFEYELILDNIRSKPIENTNLKCASFGCGPKIWKNWLSYDKYYKHEDVINIDMSDNALESDSYDIVFSSHSLEHNCFHLVKKTILGWKRILKSGGILYLSVPDLENTMKIMLDERTTFDQKYNWYMYTLFGYQVSPEIRIFDRNNNDEVDYGQIHYCSFTKEWLTKFFNENGFSINYITSYDGYGTPSIHMKATKNCGEI